MRAVLERLDMFASRDGRWVSLDPRREAGRAVAAFVSCPRRRSVVQIVLSGSAPLEVTVEGCTSAFEAEWVEPAGFVSMWLAERDNDRDWFVIDVDGGEYADLTLQFDAGQVAAFLADVALEVCLDGVAAGGAA